MDELEEILKAYSRFGDDVLPSVRQNALYLLNHAQTHQISTEEIPDSHSAVESVIRLMEGFETPYGLELFSSLMCFSKQAFLMGTV